MERLPAVNHRILGYTSTMTDTVDLPRIHVGTPLPECETAWLMDLRPEPPAPAVAPAVPARPRRRLRAAARTAYATLIAVGAATLAGCSVAGPDGLADVVIRALG